MNIFELTGLWRDALDALQDPDVSQAEALERLRAVNEDIDRKADGYGKLIRSLEAEADGLKNEASRLNARAKAFESRAASLRAMLMEAMKAQEKTKLRTTRFTFSISPTPPAVRVTDLDAALNSGYLKEPKMDESILDKAAIKRDLEAGMEIPGVELVKGEALRMR